MNLPDTTALMTRIAQSDYAGLFRAAYGDAVVSDPAQAFEKAGEAMAAFQLSAQKQPYSSKFDAVVRGQATLDAAQAPRARAVSGTGQGQLRGLPHGAARQR
jgi:cytochrome c peroxidase